MLATSDGELVARDPKVPGLALLLDDEAIGAALEEHAPNLELRKLTAAYVRYKPGTSCLVSYLTHSRLGWRFIYAKAHRRGERAKVEKMLRLPDKVEAEEPQPVAIGEETALAFFPYDRELRAARRLGTPEGRASLLGHLLPPDFVAGSTLVPLRYKPERRWVARVDGPEGPRALVKCYTRAEYASVASGVAAFASDDRVRVVRRFGMGDRLQAIAFEWLGGAHLDDLLVDGRVEPGMLGTVGAALAAVHAQPVTGLRIVGRADDVAALDAATGMVEAVLPEAGDLARSVARRVTGALGVEPDVATPVHGDFSADQVLFDSGQVAVVDFDEAALGDPVADLALFVATLQRDALEERLSPDRAETLAEEFTHGYVAAGGADQGSRLAPAVAAWLLRLAPEPFRYRRPDWPAKMRSVLLRASEVA